MVRMSKMSTKNESYFLNSGPSEAKMTCKDNRDGSCTVEVRAFLALLL